MGRRRHTFAAFHWSVPGGQGLSREQGSQQWKHIGIWSVIVVVVAAAAAAAVVVVAVLVPVP